MHKYERLDQIYEEFPEILELVKASQRVVQESYVMEGAKKNMRYAMDQMKKAGIALDNRNR